MVAKDSKVWFHTIQRGDLKKVNLFCFCYAGGNTDIFYNWHRFLLPEIGVYTLRLPGRGARIKEKNITDWNILINTISKIIIPLLKQPFIFFGHSFGAKVAFELTKKLERDTYYSPKHIIISGSSCPDIPFIYPGMSCLSKTKLIEKLIMIHSASREIFEYKNMFQILEPSLRADIYLTESYPQSVEKIKTPLTAFCGNEDPIDPENNMQGWKNYTISSFKFKKFNGQHLFLHQNEKEICFYINSLLREEISYGL